MRCRHCRDWSGWFSRICRECRRLLSIYHQNRGELGISQFLDLFAATGASRDKIQKFLNADPYGSGSIGDHITADMANRLMADMGIAAQQTARDVKRIRESGGGQVE